MALRRVLLSLLPVGLLVLVFTLAGCSGPTGAAEPSSEPSSGGPSGEAAASPDSRPTPASSRGPARNVPRPVLPEAAKQNTKEGFEAFTQYWFDTVTYGLENNDPNVIKNVSRSDCKVCNAYFSDALDSATGGGWYEGPRWRVTGFLSDMSRDPLKQALGQFLLEESASSRFDAQGSILKSRKGGNDNRLKEIYAIYEDGRWLASQLGQA
ncbi:DUF6318 family protein [Sinomonas sp. JGH33]|uniref:DUF6318 family protein n=1 Tax=Sinomonas terricola TaxID=3110330 RepID=A0ABU5T4G3_9MICC|nr:DUF6318 family protein [Sinomonas sp. JGH33]MEA5454561.1 DUF6318 family protein [Sinomonas sp. JGH33]